MKRIFFISAFLVLTFWVKAQYPIPQNIGSPNTLVQVPANGGFRASLVNRSFADTTAANVTPIDAYPGAQIFTTGDETFWVRNAEATKWINLSAGESGDLVPFYGCVSGCTVTWIQNYEYEVAASVYYIGGVRYESPAATVTLDASDPTNDRIDVFVLTTSGVADNVTGTPSANPLEPDIDPLTQLGVSFALVTAASTEPTITNNWIYRENAGPPAEWTMATVAASINLASTNFPYAGTRDIEATNMPALASFTATSSTTVTWGNYDALVFKIRSKGNWTQNRPMYIYIYSSSGGVKKGPVILTTGQYGFNSSTTGSYQNITIPLSDFGALTSSDDIIQFARTGGSGTIGWYIDDIQLTNINFEPPVGSGTVTNVSIANLSPLFLATVNNPTTAPSIFFTLMDGAGGTVFGNTQNVNASPAYTATPILGRTGTTGTLGFRGATSGTVTITPAAAAGTWTLTLPTNDGDANQVLQTNGSGVTSWVTVSSGFTTADNGLTANTATNVQLGGTLLQNTTITQSTFNLTFASSATTGTTTSSALVFTGNSLTSGTGFYLSSTSLSSGSLMNLSVNSTAAASDLQKGINVSMSGANSNNGQDTYGVYSSNTHTGGTSFNYGLYGISSGGTFNYGVYGSGSTYGVYGTSEGAAISGNTTNGTAVDATAINGSAIFAQSIAGIGITAQSTSNVGFNFLVNPASTSTTVTVGNVIRTTTGTAANNIGGAVDFYVETDAATNQVSNRLISIWATAANATRTSQFTITGVTSTTTQDWLILGQSGYMQLRNMTVSEAGAITPANGMIIYVSDTDGTFTSVGFWGRENGVWVKL